MNWAVLHDDWRLLAICVAIVLFVSLSLFFLSRCRPWTATIAIIFTIAWVIFLLPDTQYYLATRDAAQLFSSKISDYEIDNGIEPFYRRDYILGYVLVLLPVPFVFLGSHLRRRQRI